MQRALTILALLVGLSAGAALADDDCFVPMADWRPREAVARLAAENGWTVRRIKIDDGCYEIEGDDADGRRIEATVHPATLRVIEFHYKDGDGPRRPDREEKSEDRGRPRDQDER
ncbi:PepSY domain-containing protein [Hansschlegelia zhihuaiae]|uniref:PepSY domain-containing protein n=1 Tax=Hansschlegelia zhihuaiae TaxID=405005 RepID=A0A4Q0MNW1_9HYPH|nr:PepSY domain-containing protein [Hansschlegelia zhihuaiae]RXF75577.1 PepSY domain-containing protein [Hansschlegelia zhihuaiae]